MLIGLIFRRSVNPKLISRRINAVLESWGYLYVFELLLIMLSIYGLLDILGVC